MRDQVKSTIRNHLKMKLERLIHFVRHWSVSALQLLAAQYHPYVGFQDCFWALAVVHRYLAAAPTAYFA